MDPDPSRLAGHWDAAQADVTSIRGDTLSGVGGTMSAADSKVADTQSWTDRLWGAEGMDEAAGEKGEGDQKQRIT